MRPPRVLVIYNEPVLPADHPEAASEHDVVETARVVAGHLADAGLRVERLGVGADPGPLLRALQDDPPDAVFNLFEGLATRTETEISVAGLLEWLQVPFTGSPPLAMAIGRDKVRTKHLLRGAGLPTPAFCVVEKGPAPDPCPVPWPAIVKPACQDSSVGIEQASVVTDQAQLERRVEYVLERYGGPVLIEQFVRGREFHVTLIEDPGDDPERPELTMLPLAEILYKYADPAAYWPIYSYDAKWAAETVEYVATPLETPVYLDDELAERIGRVTRQAFRLAGLRDYARLDVRLGEDGTPYILEVNPNPYINSISITGGLEAVGRDHGRFLAERVWAALARAGRLRPAPGGEMPVRV